MYRTTNSKQTNFDDQFFYYKMPDLKDHIYIKLEQAIDWKKLNQEFKKYYNSEKGRLSIPIKNMVLLLLIKHIENISDEELIIKLSTDLAMQKVLNLSFIDCQVKIKYIKTKRGRTKKVRGYIDPSSLTAFRKRIEIEGVKYLEELLESYFDSKGKNKTRRVTIDTTVSPSNILYPTDINLLETARKFLIQIITKYSKIKYRTYPRVARKVFLNYIKLGRKKRQLTKTVHGKIFRFAKRNFKQVKNVMLYAKDSMTNREREIIFTIEKLLEQQKEILEKIPRSGKKYGIVVKNRIVSIFRPYVRPMPRGKIPNPTEFGSKILLEMRAGFITLLNLTFDNVADCELIQPHFARWKNMTLGGDRGFHSPVNTNLAKEVGVGKYYIEKKGKRGHPKSKSLKRIRGKRAELEARIGLSKRKHGLGNVLYGRGVGGEEQWVRLSILGMNFKHAVSL